MSESEPNRLRPFKQEQDVGEGHNEKGSGYSIKSMEAPSEVESGEEFSIEVTVCCNGTEECVQDDYELFVQEAISGPLGLWSYPIINSRFNNKEKVEIQTTPYKMAPGCADSNPSNSHTIEGEGLFILTATVGSAKQTRSIRVK